MSGYGPPSQASRYLDNSVATASPARLLVLLYDRLLLDLDRAMACFATNLSAGTHLLHAQEILLELRGSLVTESWSGGPALASIYVFSIEQLIAANTQRSITIVAEVRDVLAPLRDAWNEAATSLATPPASSIAGVAAGIA